MTPRVEAAVADLAALASEVRDEFGALSGDQVNWKPAAERWSVAQCFDHLIITHGQYFPVLERLARGEATPTFWQRLSPFSGLFGRFLIGAVAPDNPRKVKTASKAQPGASRLDDRIIDRYTAHQSELIERLGRLPDSVDLSTIVTSPLLAFVTYSLDDTLTILTTHGRRHRNQARRVVASSGFPAF